jgi:alanyl-tRNA synthetase
MEADRLRQAFTKFFVERGHAALAPASLVTPDPTVLFTIAGMVQFKPFFLGEAEPTHSRVTTIQPCMRTDDIELVGLTARHCTFFEMLGNFSFGDYFKEKAIPWAWELVTDVLGFDPDRLWATVHLTDDEAAEIWPSATSCAAERVQRLDEDNFWKMGDTGPCGPSSEIFFDRGPQFGPDGGPAAPGADESDRYVEIWNLVFMQYNRSADGTLSPLPQRNIDTGAGLDRLLAVMQGVPHVQAIDCVAPIVERAAQLTGTRPGEDARTDSGLRIIADHSRAFTFAVADGVFPSNEGRGYVLRRLIRRAVLRSYQLGRRELATPELVEAVLETMGSAYPKLVADRDRITTVVVHEEEAFLRTLRQGTALLEEALAGGNGTSAAGSPAAGTRAAGTPAVVSGELAFRLHDTFGFPFELTKEIVAERGITVDEGEFAEHMESQRRRAREASKGGAVTPEETAERWREIRSKGPTQFLGYEATEADGIVVAVLASALDPASFENVDGERVPDGKALIEVFLDRTPFYAEGGGQVGDTGIIETPTGRLRVLDTNGLLDGLTRHVGYVIDGSVATGQQSRAVVDHARREAIRRNHTGTHLLHYALRRVLGEHVRQQGSFVAPERLRFDFSHFGPLTAEEVAAIEDLVNERVLADEPVQVVESDRSEAEAAGAIAFFGDKYGDRVRVVHAGHDSVELCGGIHVSALGMIGPLRIISEGSIGANTRRIEATTGTATIERSRETERVLEAAAELLRAKPDELPDALARLVARQRSLEGDLKRLRSGQLGVRAEELAAAAHEEGAQGVVVAREDGLDQNELRELALSVRDRPGVRGVALAGSPADGRVALVVAVEKGSGLDARAAVGAAGKAVGGGGGGSAELATAGGRDASGLDAALAILAGELRPSS